MMEGSTKGRPIPSSRTATRHVGELGKGAKHEYLNLREKYKGEGLSPREAVERAYVELRIELRWREQKRRVEMREALGEGVPLTPAEMGDVSPGHQPLWTAKAESIGEQDMPLAEQVKWAMRWAAKVQDGADPPVRFPCEGALFWYQSAVGNRRDFERLLLRVEAPGGDPDNLYLQDSQYQFSEIEKQIQRALDEVGPRLRKLEKDFLEKKKDERPVT